MLISSLKPGTFGLSHGKGLLGLVIRQATESWAGHAFIYIGEHNFGTQDKPDVAPAIVEARWPTVKISHASHYPEAKWAVNQPLNDGQRAAIVGRAFELVGDKYDWPAYIGFGLEVLHAATAKDLKPLMCHDQWRVCSAVVADCNQHAGFDLTNGTGLPNLVSPANLFSQAVEKGWF